MNEVSAKQMLIHDLEYREQLRKIPNNKHSPNRDNRKKAMRQNSRDIHNDLTAIGFPRRKDGNKLGLRKRMQL